jgi:proteasome alpha subunit
MMRSNQYDAAITIFSPEGRLYQVEYALELVKRGAPIVGVYSSEGVVLAANDSPEGVLDEPDFQRKIFQIDDHMGAAIAGLSSDARLLIDMARVSSQSNRLLYDEPADVESIVGKLSERMQAYTQHGGVRPFGVSMILAGVDTTGAKVFTTDPSGQYRAYKAVAIGRNAEEANRMLEEQYLEGLNMDEAVHLAIQAVQTASGDGLKTIDIRVAVIPVESKTMRMLSEEEVGKHLA